MSIGSISGSGFGFGQQSLRVNISKQDSGELKKQLSSKSSKIDNNDLKSLQAGAALAGPRGPTGFPGGEPPKELSKEDLTRLRDEISKKGGADAGKIDQLIKDFDQYDTQGTGKISTDQFKSYADKNGINLPKPQQRPPGGGEFPQQIPQEFKGGEGPSSQAVAKGAVAGFLNKYASAAAAAGATPQASATEVGTTSPSQATAATSGTASGSAKSVSEMTDDELKAAAAKGDANAQKEIESRKAEKSAESEEGTDQKVSASLSVEA